MPTCSVVLRACAPRARGFGYLALLWLMALLGATLAAAGQRWTQAAQQEREAELLFRGTQIVRAIEQYRASTPAGALAWPRALSDLVEDTRHDPPRHHLRRAFSDPFSGTGAGTGAGVADWQLLLLSDGGIAGVHSRAEHLALRRIGLPAQVSVNPPLGASGPRVRDWHFVVADALIDEQKDEETRP